MATTRTTISLDETDLTELQGLAEKAEQSLSAFLVSRGLERNEAAGLEKFDIRSIEIVQKWLSKGLYPRSELGKLELKGRGIADAISDFQSAATIYGQEFSDALVSPEFVPAMVPYPLSRKAESVRFQKQLLSELSSLPDIGMRGSLGVGVDSFLDEELLDSPRNQALVAHHFVRPGLIGSKPLMYLFPFFRPNNRRPQWGVIDYGIHKYIGILLHKKTFTKTLNSAGFTEDMSKLSKNRAYSWLGQEVIEALCKSESRNKFGYREGFFEGEIAAVLWSHAQTHLRFYSFEVYRKPYSADELKLALADEECGLFIVDLQESHILEKNTDWQLVKFPHYADVPVGIGFTLSLLPRLLVHNNWAVLKDISYQLIKEYNFASVLEECGIEINTRPQLTT